MPARMKIDGLKLAEKKAVKAGEAIPEELEEIVAGMVRRAARAARSAFPVYTGTARSTIRTLRARKGKRRASAAVAWGGDDAPYAPWIEFGGTISTPTHSITRPYRRDGRYVFPSIKRESDRSGEQASRAAWAAVRKFDGR